MAREGMSGTELAAALFAAQGHLIMACTTLRRIGSIDFYTTAARIQSHTPLRIVAESCREEYGKQVELARQLAPHLVGSTDGFCSGLGWPFYYRVEAAD